MDFNPRPREEGDTVYRQRRVSRRNFNPRPREEGDSVSLEDNMAKTISIHALVKRATCEYNKTGISKVISIHALVKRATESFKLPVEKLIISIHALVKRATKERCISLGTQGHFNPRPREEGDESVFRRL